MAKFSALVLAAIPWSAGPVDRCVALAESLSPLPIPGAYAFMGKEEQRDDRPKWVPALPPLAKVAFCAARLQNGCGAAHTESDTDTTRSQTRGRFELVPSWEGSNQETYSEAAPKVSSAEHKGHDTDATRNQTRRNPGRAHSRTLTDSRSAKPQDMWLRLSPLALVPSFLRACGTGRGVGEGGDQDRRT